MLVQARGHAEDINISAKALHRQIFEISMTNQFAISYPLTVGIATDNHYHDLLSNVKVPSPRMSEEKLNSQRHNMEHFADTLLSITRDAVHACERDVHGLLTSLEDFYRQGQLKEGEYGVILRKAMGVGEFFNYDIELLGQERNDWYRASIVRQMGQQMLSALDDLRPDLAKGLEHNLSPC
jgi:hypothetical protein